MANADVPIDLGSPFLKTVIYQRKIGGYGAGPLERKEIQQGEKKENIYEFKKNDGTVFLVSEKEIMAVLPVFPSSQIPCEKPDIVEAIGLLVKSKQSLSGQEEVSDSSLEKWRGLLQALEEFESKLLVASDQIQIRPKIFLLAWILAWPFLVLCLLLAGLKFAIRSQIGLALGLLCLGLIGGGVFLGSLLPRADAGVTRKPTSNDLEKKIFWNISCAQKKGMLPEGAQFKISADEWLNFLFERVRFESGPAGLFQTRLLPPSFRQAEGGLFVQQPVQVGPVVLPLLVELSPSLVKKSLEQVVIRKIWLGRIPLPEIFSRKWSEQLFAPYHFIWTVLNQGGAVNWELGPRTEMVIQITPAHS